MNRTSGHTLIELLTVVGIMSVTAATTMPSLVESMPKHRLKKAAWQLYIDMEQAKARAVSENRPVQITMNNAQGEYSMWVDTNSNGAQDVGETTYYELEDADKVDLYAYPSTVSFEPAGTLDTSYYYFYMRISTPGAGHRYIYVFPNGHIDPMRIQDS